MSTWVSKLKYSAFLLAVPVVDALAQAPQCAAPQCAAPYYTPNCNRPANANQQSEPVTPPGMFVAPPTSGDVLGESNGLGFHGPALHIPQSTIRLPSLQFGGLFRSRRGPEMITDQSRATYQAQPALKMQLTRPQTNPSANQQSEPVTPPNCTVPPAPCFGQTASTQAEEIARLQQQVTQLTALVGQLATMQQTQTQARPSQAELQSSIQPAGYLANGRQVSDSGRRVAAGPSRDEQQYIEQYEQKCRELSELQEQLASTQAEYQALLEAKQQKLIQERDARMRKKLGESINQDQPIQARPTTGPSRSQPVESTRREPLRLRGTVANESRIASTLAPEASDETPEQNTDERLESVPEPAPSGSRLGRWFKASK